jgi:hypothetical protein
MLHDVTRPSAFDQALQKPASFAHTASVFNEARQHFLQAFVEAWEHVGGAIF